MFREAQQPSALFRRSFYNLSMSSCLSPHVLKSLASSVLRVPLQRHGLATSSVATSTAVLSTFKPDNMTQMTVGRKRHEEWNMKRHRRRNTRDKREMQDNHTHIQTHTLSVSLYTSVLAAVALVITPQCVLVPLVTTSTASSIALQMISRLLVQQEQQTQIASSVA